MNDNGKISWRKFFASRAAWRRLEVVQRLFPTTGTDKDLALQIPGRIKWLSREESQFPLLCVVVSVGLLFVGIGFRMAWLGQPAAEAFYWLGFLIMCVPVSARLLTDKPETNERISLLILLGIGVYLIKVLHSPNRLVFFDELLLWRGTDNIIISGKLFQYHPTLPVSAYYPGLPITTFSLHTISGLSLFASAIIIIGVARVIMEIALFQLYHEISGSQRIASVAALAYTSNPNFVYFNAQYSYESLAIALAVLAFSLIVWQVQTKVRPFYTILAMILGFMVVATHHVSSCFLLSGLIILFLASMLTQVSLPKRIVVLIMTGYMFVLVIVWFTQVATATTGYLAGPITDMINELRLIMRGEQTSREMFGGDIQQKVALWERLTVWLGVMIAFGCYCWGSLMIFIHNRKQTAYLAMLLISVLYPISLAFRFTAWGPELSGRITAFVYIAVAFIITLSLVHIPSWRIIRWFKKYEYVAALVAFIIMFMSGVIMSYPAWGRLPGPYRVASDVRSVEALGVNTAEWSQYYLGTHNRLIADRINGNLMVALGHQNQVTSMYDKVFVGEFFLSPELRQDDKSIFCRDGVQYVVVDSRLTEQLPGVGFYFEMGETGGKPYTTPLPSAALDKFEEAEYLQRIYDIGSIQIYKLNQDACNN